MLPDRLPRNGEVASLPYHPCIGTGLVIFGVLVVAGVGAAWYTFPFLLPLLIPLFLVWIFVAAVHGSGKSRG